MKNKPVIIAALLSAGLLGVFSFMPLKPHQQYQAPLFDNLGSYHREVSTTVPDAQRFFDQGMTLFYGFDWSESARSFREATRLDPNCAMCYWGLALALDNKINAPLNGKEFTEGQTAIQHALALASQTKSMEQEMIQALALKYLHAPVYKEHDTAFSCHASSSEIDVAKNGDKKAYIDAMEKIAKKYPDDLDVQTLYASVLNFSVAGDQPKFDNPAILTATKILEQVLAKDPNNIGANHYYIHIVEPFAHPGLALKSADRLKTLVPGSQHLVHMPAHIYYLTGRYHEGTQSNIQAIEAYKEYNKSCIAQGFEPEINYLYFHNYDYLRTTALMEGNQHVSLKATRQMVEEPYGAWLKNEPELQWFMAIPYFVETRFALWDDVLKHPMPEQQYGYARGMWHYARGMALANTEKLDEANNEVSHLQKIIHQGVTNSNLNEPGIKLMTLAQFVLQATIADRKGDEKLTIDHLLAAMKIQDEMGYAEPPKWYFPIKQALGDAYLKWKKPDQAKAMYELDLAQYPENGWSLYGVEKSLRALGDNEKADLIHAQFEKAWQHADIPAPVAMF